MSERSWPVDWEQRKDGQDCPMCASLGAGDNEYTLVVTELTSSEVRLERRSLLPGYCIVVWKYGHVAEPTQLDDDAAAAYWKDVVAVARAIEARFDPMKINLLTLGNWVPHLHTHVVPRYKDDPTPGGPLAYEAMFSEEAVDTETLEAHVAAIRSALSAEGSK